MAGNPILNRRNNYICPYCNHKSWKRSWQAAYDHIHREHPQEVELDETREELARVKAQLRKAEKDKKPEPKYAYQWAFCTYCRRMEWMGLPIGQAFAFIRHTGCGQTGGILPIANANERVLK